MPVLILPAPAVRLKASPVDVPAAPLVSEMVPVLVSLSIVLPVELALSVAALSVLVPVKLMPPLPAVTVTVAALSAPVALRPLVLPASLKVNDEPELAPRFMVPV